MKSIEQIQQKNAQRGNLILKAFNQNSPVKYFEKLEKSEQQNAVETIIKAFNEGKIPEEDIDILVKAKYIRREGTPGNYKYIYKESNLGKRNKEGESKGKLKTGSKVNVKGVGEGVYGYTNEEGNYVKFKDGSDGYFEDNQVYLIN